jgi:hypothetical protein
MRIEAISFQIYNILREITENNFPFPPEFPPLKTRLAFGNADLNADLSTLGVGKFLPTLIFSQSKNLLVLIAVKKSAIIEFDS